jgi:hypothetical protein
MGNVYGVNYTKTLDPTPQSGMLAAGLWNGKVRVQVDVYEAVSLAIASVLYIAKLPKGAVFLGISNVVADDLGSATTLAFGIVGTGTKFLAATVFTTANQQKFLNAIDGLQYVFTAALPDVICTTGAELANGTIKTEIYYAQE